jgi:hypothetical protein
MGAVIRVTDSTPARAAVCQVMPVRAVVHELAMVRSAARQHCALAQVGVTLYGQEPLASHTHWLDQPPACDARGW